MQLKYLGREQGGLFYYINLLFCKSGDNQVWGAVSLFCCVCFLCFGVFFFGWLVGVLLLFRVFLLLFLCLFVVGFFLGGRGD